MRTLPAGFGIFLVGMTVLGTGDAFAEKVPVEKIKSIATVITDQNSGTDKEIHRMPLAGTSRIPEAVNDCKKAGEQYLERTRLAGGSWKCCAVTEDGSSHCDVPLRSQSDPHHLYL